MIQICGLMGQAAFLGSPSIKEFKHLFSSKPFLLYSGFVFEIN